MMRTLTIHEAEVLERKARKDLPGLCCPNCGEGGLTLRSYLAGRNSLTGEVVRVVVPFFCPRCPDVEPIKKTYDF